MDQPSGVGEEGGDAEEGDQGCVEAQAGTTRSNPAEAQDAEDESCQER